MSNFNPEAFKRVPRANSRKRTKTGAVSYDIRVKPSKSTFEVSEELFNRLGLANKGLSQGAVDYNGQVVLTVDPLELAVFFKGQDNKDGQKKGRHFKNSELAKSLAAKGAIDPASSQLSYLFLTPILNDNGSQVQSQEGSLFFTLGAAPTTDVVQQAEPQAAPQTEPQADNHPADSMSDMESF